MKWILIFLLMVCPVSVGANDGQGVNEGRWVLPKGYIRNDNGGKCWYTQKTDPKSTYFHGSLKGWVGIMSFDDPQCMSDSGVGLIVNKMMINIHISGWYSHPDAKFQTRVSEMFNGSLLQKKGRCIQSKTYPYYGIFVDYFVKNDSITGVIHGMAIGGCKN